MRGMGCTWKQGNLVSLVHMEMDGLKQCGGWMDRYACPPIPIFFPHTETSTSVMERKRKSSVCEYDV